MALRHNYTDMPRLGMDPVNLQRLSIFLYCPCKRIFSVTSTPPIPNSTIKS